MENPAAHSPLQGEPSFGLPANPGPSSMPPQLPPQMFTTAAQLLGLTDKKLSVVLRDGRKLIGILRSWDQFGTVPLFDISTKSKPIPNAPEANLVLQYTIERIFAPRVHSVGAETLGGLYADVPLGVFIVRGENVLLLGEIDLDKDDDPPPGYELADVDAVRTLASRAKALTTEKEKIRFRKLARIGFEGENMGEVLM